MEQPLDISAILRPAVYLLWYRGRVAYIGKARCPLTAIINHRLALSHNALSRLFPHRAIAFDGIELIPCTADRALALQSALISMHQPTRQYPHAPAADPIAHAPARPTDSLRLRL